MNAIERDIRTINTMIEMYCKGVHNPVQSPCAECRELQEYATTRTNKCKRGKLKGNCDSCTIRCYRPEMREKIRAAMRYAGPRMAYTHPGMAIRHTYRKIMKKRYLKRQEAEKARRMQERKE